MPTCKFATQHTLFDVISHMEAWTLIGSEHLGVANIQRTDGQQQVSITKSQGFPSDAVVSVQCGDRRRASNNRPMMK